MDILLLTKSHGLLRFTLCIGQFYGFCQIHCIMYPPLQHIQNSFTVLYLFTIIFFFRFRSVQSLSCVQLFETLWTAACQASLSITISWSFFTFTSIVLVMLSNHLILCHSLLLLPSIFPNFRVFSIKFPLCIRWPKYWSFSFSSSPCNEYSRLISFRID